MMAMEVRLCGVEPLRHLRIFHSTTSCGTHRYLSEENNMLPTLLLLVAGYLLFPATAVWAHAYLVKSIPAQRAVLYRAPARIQLWFNERLESGFSSLSVRDADGKLVETGKSEVAADDPKRLSATVKPLPAGRYFVKFRVLSVDGHIAEDQFPFTIK
jgi:copper resistance protein C